MIKLVDILNENLDKAKAGWGDDPKKPKEIDRIEVKAWKWRNSLKRGWTQTTQYSPKLERFRRQWEKAVEKHKKEWQPKYNFGDVLA